MIVGLIMLGVLLFGAFIIFVNESDIKYNDTCYNLLECYKKLDIQLTSKDIHNINLYEKKHPLVSEKIVKDINEDPEKCLWNIVEIIDRQNDYFKIKDNLVKKINNVNFVITPEFAEPYYMDRYFSGRLKLNDNKNYEKECKIIKENSLYLSIIYRYSLLGKELDDEKKVILKQYIKDYPDEANNLDQQLQRFK